MRDLCFFLQFFYGIKSIFESETYDFGFAGVCSLVALHFQLKWIFFSPSFFIPLQFFHHGLRILINNYRLCFLETRFSWRSSDLTLVLYANCQCHEKLKQNWIVNKWIYGEVIHETAPHHIHHPIWNVCLQLKNMN